MKSLRSYSGYVSLKIKHIEKQAHIFPSLIGLQGEKSSEQEVDGAQATREDDSGTCEILNQKMQKKITLTRKVNEERICENISNITSYRDDSLLFAVLLVTLKEDDIDTEFEENDKTG